MSQTIQDQMNERFRVRVYKPFPHSDDRHSLEGERMKKEVVDGEERHYFEISGARADYINRMFRHYKVSEPFIPGVDNTELLKITDKPQDEEEKK